MTDADAPVNPYDEVPYQSIALTETHPDRLATVAALLGLDAPATETARVLELGCAGGGNLIPMALGAPGGRFVGIDYSPRQIDQARQLAEKAGASNVEFHAMSLTDVTPDFGRFDYILSHGVYSWVPEPVKEAILRISRENLEPTGLAYISYNVFPGWHVPGMLREMMMYHVRNTSDPAARARSARALLDFLAASVPEQEGHYAKVLKDEALTLRPHADSYLLHEHLEEHNHPIYFHEFVKRAGARGSRSWATPDSGRWRPRSSPRWPRSSTRSPPTRSSASNISIFSAIAGSGGRSSATTRRPPSPRPTRKVKEMRASASVWPTTQPVDFSAKTSVEFRGLDGVIRLGTSEPVFKAALVHLTEVQPRALTFAELWEATRAKLARHGQETGDAADALAQRLLQAYGANSVELHRSPPPRATEPSATPRAFAVADRRREFAPRPQPGPPPDHPEGLRSPGPPPARRLARRPGHRRDADRGDPPRRVPDSRERHPAQGPRTPPPDPRTVRPAQPPTAHQGGAALGLTIRRPISVRPARHAHEAVDFRAEDARNRRMTAILDTPGFPEPAGGAIPLRRLPPCPHPSELAS